MEKLKCKVVTLATEDKNSPIQLGVNFYKNIPGEFRGTYFHLYFISNEEIQVGDLVIGLAAHLNKIYKVKDITHNGNLLQLDPKCEMYPTQFRKIVATTDPSLNLPLIPKSFIEEYVEANGKIDEVEIEAVMVFDKRQPFVADYQNSVTISKPKETWTRDEVVSLCAYAYAEGFERNKMSIQEWIDKYM